MTYLKSSKNITEFLLEYIQTPKMILAFKKHPHQHAGFQRGSDLIILVLAY